MKKICVLGSINMDLVLKVDRLAMPGETILSKDIKKIPGGKGANQAVAAKRLGCEVIMIAKVGKDENGFELIKALENDSIDTRLVEYDPTNQTGIAVISVDIYGNNSIIVAPGANMKIEKDQIEKSKEAIKNSSILIAQFETSIEATINAFKFAKENGVTTLLNPAPAKVIPNELLKFTDIIIPNETEAYELTKVSVESEEGIIKSSNEFIKKGVKFVVLTLGERGAALVSYDKFIMVPAYKVKAIDTTAAGDSFIGGFATKLQKEEEINFNSIEKAIKFANKVSSIVVQRQGAQPSLPYLHEIKKIYGED